VIPEDRIEQQRSGFVAFWQGLLSAHLRGLKLPDSVEEVGF
jgi:hypothetical protein